MHPQVRHILLQMRDVLEEGAATSEVDVYDLSRLLGMASQMHCGESILVLSFGFEDSVAVHACTRGPVAGTWRRIVAAPSHR